MMQQIVWLALVALCGCVPVVATFYQPRGDADVKSISGGCSMSPLLQVTQHLPGHVDVEVSAVAKTPGIAHASIAISINVPGGTTVRLAEPAIALREGPNAPALKLQIDKIRKPRTLVNGQVSDYLEPSDPLSGPEGYGISVELPQENPEELIITLPPLEINGQHVEVGPVEFVLKTRPHVTGFCSVTVNRFPKNS